METVYKKISLESATGRLGTKITSYDRNNLLTPYDMRYIVTDNSDWGLIPSDIIILNVGDESWQKSLLTDFSFIAESQGSDNIFKYNNLLKLKDKLPLSVNYNNDVVLRYTILVERYHFFLNFLKKMVYYRNICRNVGDNTTLVEISDTVWELNFGIAPTYVDEQGNVRDNDEYYLQKYKTALQNNWSVFRSKDEAGGDARQQFVCVNEDIDLFNSYFVLTDDELSYFEAFIKNPDNKIYVTKGIIPVFPSEETGYEDYSIYFDEEKNLSLLFYDFVSYFLDNFVEDESIYAAPYLNVSLLLSSSIEDNGVFQQYYEPWVRNRRYYVGDVVSYTPDGTEENLKYYRLYYNTDPEVINTYGVDTIEITKPVYDGLIKSNGIDGMQVLTGGTQVTVFAFEFSGYVLADNEKITIEVKKRGQILGDTIDIMVSKYDKASDVARILSETDLSEYGLELDSVDTENGTCVFTTTDMAIISVRALYMPQELICNVSITGDRRYYINRPYYKGFFDSNKDITYIDEIDDEGNLVFKHWKECIIEGDPNSTEYGTIIDGESYLQDLLRNKTSYDDDSNVLPFIIPSGTGNNVEIRYLLGAMNTRYENDDIYSDVLSSISLYESGGTMETPLRKFVFENGRYKTIESDGTITYDDENPQQIGVYDVLSGSDFIQFEYYIGAMVDVSGDTIDATGVRHKEAYSIERVKDEYYRINGNFLMYWMTYDGQPNESTTFYVDTIDDLPSGGTIVDWEIEGPEYRAAPRSEYGNFYYVNSEGEYYTPYSNVWYVDIDLSKTYTYSEESGFTSDEKVISKIEYTITGTTAGNFIDVPVFANGLTDKFMSVGGDYEIDIDRGQYAAWERHGILGEINTFEDLENYRNNMFRL